MLTCHSLAPLVNPEAHQHRHYHGTSPHLAFPIGISYVVISLTYRGYVCTQARSTYSLTHPVPRSSTVTARVCLHPPNQTGTRTWGLMTKHSRQKRLHGHHRSGLCECRPFLGRTRSNTPLSDSAPCSVLCSFGGVGRMRGSQRHGTCWVVSIYGAR